MTLLNPRVRRLKTAVALSIVALAASFFILSGRVGAQAIGDRSVTDITSCAATNVNIVRTPYQFRRQELLSANTSVLTMQAVFTDFAPGVTFHITHVSGQFFTPGSQTFHVRLYKGGTIMEAFNVTDPSFHLENSTIFVRTLNQPVDLNLAMENDPSQWDMQFVRSSGSGVATGIVEFWGYLTSDTCPVRGQ